MSLPPLLAPYAPPSARPAALAAGTAPLLVLLVFTLLVCRLVAADTALAALLALGLWVGVEMHAFQRALDRYNADYVQRHLAWRSGGTLEQLLARPETCPATREFVLRYLASDRRLLPDGQLV